jgi:hypothetical protein
LDDDIWDVIIHFYGHDNLEMKLGKLDITYLSLLALIEIEDMELMIQCTMLKIREKVLQGCFNRWNGKGA